MKTLVETLLKIVGVSMAALAAAVLVIINHSSSLQVSDGGMILCVVIIIVGLVIMLVGYLMHFVRWCDDRHYASGLKIRPMQRR